MQHKKALIAAAVAAALAVSANASAEATVYGKIHTSVASVSQDVAGTKNSSTEIKSNASRIGVKSDKALANGLTFIGQLEFEVDYAGDTQKSSTDLIKLRDTFVGIKGDFGTVLVGNHDTPHKMATGKLDPFGDTYGDYNNIITVDNRLGNVVAYVNKFGSVGFAAAYYAGNDSVTGENKNNATSVMANYDQGPLYLAGAVESYSDTVAGDIKTASKFGAGYTFGPASVGVVYETLAMDSAKDQTETYVSLKYKTNGSATISAAFGSRDDGVSSTKDAAMSVVGVNFKMDKAASVYALYASGTDGGLNHKGKLAGDANALSVGLVYKF